MEHNSKYNTLSAKELFELMGNPSAQKKHVPPLDDFEKEAIEGYAMQTKASAKALNADIDKRISEKVRTKHKIIWFSAAASVILILIVSIIFLRENNNSLNTTIVENTNEQKPIELNTITEQQNNSEITTIENDLKSEPENQKTNSTNNAVGGLIINKGDNAKQANTKSIQATDADAKLNGPEELAKDDKIQTLPSVEKNEVDRKSTVLQDKKNDTREEERISYSNASAPAVKTNTDDVVALEIIPNTKKEAESLKKESNAKAKQQADALSETTLINDETKVQTKPINELNTFILAQVKKENPKLILKGTYHVNAIINADKTIQVISIKNTSNDCSECILPIVNALNKKKNWVPEMENKKPITSKKEFDIEF